MSAPTRAGDFEKAVLATRFAPQDYALHEYQKFIDSLGPDRFRYAKPFFLEVRPDHETLTFAEEDFYRVDCFPQDVRVNGKNIRVSPILESADPGFFEAFDSGYFPVGGVLRVGFKFSRSNDPVEEIAMLFEQDVPTKSRIVRPIAQVKHSKDMRFVRVEPYQPSLNLLLT